MLIFIGPVSALFTTAIVIGSLPDLQLLLLIGQLLAELFDLFLVFRDPPVAFCDPAPDILQLRLIFSEAVILLFRLG